MHTIKNITYVPNSIKQNASALATNQICWHDIPAPVGHLALFTFIHCLGKIADVRSHINIGLSDVTVTLFNAFKSALSFYLEIYCCFFLCFCFFYFFYLCFPVCVCFLLFFFFLQVLANACVTPRLFTKYLNTFLLAGRRELSLAGMYIQTGWGKKQSSP